MKKLKWILIISGLAAILVLTIPANLSDPCNHNYETVSCNVKRCTECGNTSESDARHTWKVIDCYSKVCTVCSTTQRNSHSMYNKPCTNEWVCSGCGLTEYREQAKHYVDYTHPIMIDGCHYYYACTQCNERVSEGEQHKWSSFHECKDSYCIYCGIDAPETQAHNFRYSLFYLFGFCKDCGHVMFQIPRFRFVASFIGLIMSIVAFVFIYLNRKRITVQGGKYIRIATPDAHLREEEIF